jgi:catechol 2,3-dioxygenase-like lactoylglutathione lyase family enzyme
MTRPGVRGLHHTALVTDVYDASHDFYTNFLGFTTLMSWTVTDDESLGRASYLDSGNGACVELFELLVPVEAAEPSLGWRPGQLAHLCLSVNDVDPIVADAREAGVTVSGPSDVDLADVTGHGVVTVRLCFLTGPAGELVELISGLPSGPGAQAG